MRKAVVIVQARWASSRLPGKVLKRLEGKSVLEHVLKRCAAIAGIDEVCCAIPISEDSNAIARKSKELGATVCRGSEEDVLDRYYRAAVQTNAEIIMRITSDCPLIDPAICSDLLTRFREERLDYASNNTPPTWPLGLDCEVMDFATLQTAAMRANLPSEREHVTPYIRTDPGLRQANLSSPYPCLADHRWTLDTPKDFQFMTEIFSRLKCYSEPYSWLSALKIVTQEPSIAQINAEPAPFAGSGKSLLEDAGLSFPIDNSLSRKKGNL